MQRFAEEKETVTNVHGVRENFLIVGDKRAEAAARGTPFEAGDRFVVRPSVVAIAAVVRR